MNAIRSLLILGIIKTIFPTSSYKYVDVTSKCREYQYPLTTCSQENIRSNTGVQYLGMIGFCCWYIGFLPFLLCLLQHSGSRIDCIFSWSTGFLRKVDMPFFYVYCNILIWEKNQYCYILAKQALCGFTILILEIPVFDVPWRHHAHGHN